MSKIETQTIKFEELQPHLRRFIAHLQAEFLAGALSEAKLKKHLWAQRFVLVEVVKHLNSEGEEKFKGLVLEQSQPKKYLVVRVVTPQNITKKHLKGEPDFVDAKTFDKMMDKDMSEDQLEKMRKRLNIFVS